MKNNFAVEQLRLVLETWNSDLGHYSCSSRGGEKGNCP